MGAINKRQKSDGIKSKVSRNKCNTEHGGIKLGKKTVTVIDIASIQQYIFNTNNLKHMIGASGIVHAATHDWVFEQLTNLGPTNVKRDSVGEWTIDPAHENLISEVVYAGGGKVVILFAESKESNTIKFTKVYTKKVLCDAPNLQPLVTHIECDLEKDVLSKTVEEAFEKLRQKKNCHE